MCGIFGMIGPSILPKYRAALDVMEHRGPDGKGEWLHPEERVYLGHRRLAIIDPEGGKQPLSNEDGSVWITFNGCIYNYVELAETLKSKGHQFKTNCDTEVIVHAYEEYGTKCVDYFIGMFSFAIWDSRNQTLFCARDRLGIKPFYYWQQQQTFLFASEIKALLATGIVERRQDNQSLQDYLVFQTIPGQKTLFQNVMKLPPGYYMIVDLKSQLLKLEQYWDVRFDVDYGQSENYYVEKLRSLLMDAVKIRLRSDVTLGAHLSGGLDSSTIVSLTSMLSGSGEKFKTFTGAFSGEQYDETRYARKVATATGSEYLDIYPNPSDFTDMISKIIYFMDEPSAGPGVFPQFMVSNLASKHVKVVLGGQGGDEIFAGYTRYLVGYLEECLKGSIMGNGHSSKYAAELAAIIPNLPSLKQYIPMLKYFWADGLFDSDDKRYYRLMNRSGDVKGIFNQDLFRNEERVFQNFQGIFYGSNADSFLNRMSYFDMKVHLPALLHVEDRTSMAFSLESRVPLLDHRIIEFMATVPTTIKFKNGEPKYLFKQAIKDWIPHEVLYRKDKMGFPVPLQQWYQTSLKDFVADILLSQSARERGIYDMDSLKTMIDNEKAFGRTIWGALCLELWFRTFIDGNGAI